eukprot:97991-Hanusia_phi.AAC.1
MDVWNLQQDMGHVRTEVDEMRRELTAGIEQTRTEIAEMRREFAASIEQTRTELSARMDRLENLIVTVLTSKASCGAPEDGKAA